MITGFTSSSSFPPTVTTLASIYSSSGWLAFHSTRVFSSAISLKQHSLVCLRHAPDRLSQTLIALTLGFHSLLFLIAVSEWNALARNKPILCATILLFMICSVHFFICSHHVYYYLVSTRLCEGSRFSYRIVQRLAMVSSEFPLVQSVY